MKQKWYKRPPKEEGYYWFYGVIAPLRGFPMDPPAMHLMYAKQGIVCWKYNQLPDGCDLYPNEVMGKWHPMTMPKPPALT